MVTKPSDQDREIPRGSVKLKLAMELCRFYGSPDAFRNLFPDIQKGTGAKHNVYTPSDIRRGRLKLMGVMEEPAASKELPPILLSRMTRGGVGKTTIAVNVAATMASSGLRTLLIDADPQSTCTSMLGIDWANDEDIVHVGRLMQMQRAKEPIAWHDGLTVRSIYADGMLDLIPADITLAGNELWLNQIDFREKSFSRLLEGNKAFFSRYDVIVIDSAPGMTSLNKALMLAAKNILAVVRPDGSTMKALEVLFTDITELGESEEGRWTPNTRIVINDYESRINTCKIAVDALRAHYTQRVDPNIIPRYASFVRQVDLYDDNKSGPILEREPNSPAAKAILDLTRSLVNAFDVKLGGLIPVVPELPRRARTSARSAA